MLSDMHPLFDDRIYWKEALSLKKFGYNVIHIGFDKENKDFISAEGIRIIAIKKRVFNNNILLHKLIKTMLFDDPHREMMNKIVEVKADAYHIHDLKVNKLGRKIRKLPWKPKIIYDIHEDYGEIMRYYYSKKQFMNFFLLFHAFIMEWKEKNRTKDYDYYIHVTEHIQDKFKRKNSLVKSELIINYSNFETDNPTSFREKKYDIIYSGLISKNRGVLEIIKSVEEVKKIVPSIKALFLGGFNSIVFENLFWSTIKQLKLQNTIDYHSYINHNEIVDLYRQSKIGICTLHPAKHFIYSIPIKIFEYMTFGLPVISSNFGYILKYIIESNSGIPVDPLNPKEISRAIEKLLTDKKLYNKFSENGIIAIKTKYNWKTEETKLLNIYNNLLKD